MLFFIYKQNNRDFELLGKGGLNLFTAYDDFYLILGSGKE